MGKTQTLGREAEDRAEAMLSRAGLRTVARNYRCRCGEIDLVMGDGKHLIFVEVRFRSSRAFGSAAASVAARQSVGTTSKPTAGGDARR